MNNSWNAVAFSKELKTKPLKVYYKKIPIVLFRYKNHIHALNDQCPHRGAPLSTGKVINGGIICPYHGWKFNGNGEQLELPGSCNFKPSHTSLIKTYRTHEEAGTIWITSNNEDNLNTPFNPNFHHHYSHYSVSTFIKANIIDIFENFLDPLHTHFIHSNIIRSNNKRHLCHVEIKNIEDGYQATYIEEKKQSGLFSKLFGRHIEKSIGRVRNQNIIEIEYHSKNALELSVVVYANQETKNNCKLLIRTYLKKQKTPFWVSAPIIFLFQFITFIQDKKILETIHKNKNTIKSFTPLIIHTDIMRPYIAMALNNELIKVDKKASILL